MEITIFEDKKMKILATLFLAVAWFTGMDMIENTAEAKIITTTPRAERAGAENIFNKEKEQYHLREASADSPLRKIQDKLVTYNPDKLNYNDGKHDRWLEPIGIADNNYPNEGASCAGVTYVKKLYEDKLAGFPDYDIVRYSDVAALLAHEFGHFVNKDTLSWVEGYPKSARRDDEFGADQMGMQLMDAVPEYSMGSVAGETSGFLGIFPTAADDLKFIEDWSYGRVKFTWDGWDDCVSFILDGVPFAPPVGDAYRFDAYGGYRRVFYLAGQIASCIHHGIWKKENIAYAPESYFFPDGRDDKTVLAVWTDSSCVGQPAKILATFHIDMKKPKESRDRFERCEANSLNYIKHLPKE
jgi:hypothetical protein